MADSKFPVPIKKVEEALPGPPLNQEAVTCFEQAYTSFVQKQSKEEHAGEIVDEIANLLTVSQKNIEEVQNQKWFQRAWRTVSGKNKKLERVNQANLLKVQKGALFFLQNLAETNGQLMETVAFAFQRVEDIQIESAKLKGYLIQIVQKYNQKIHIIEKRLDDHDNAIANLEQGNHKVLWLVLSCIGVSFTGLSYFLAPVEIRLTLAFVFFLASVLFIVLFSRQRSYIRPKGTTTATAASATQEENSVLLPQVAATLQSLLVDYVDENLISAPIQQFAENNELLNRLYSRLNKKGLERSAFGEIVHEILGVEAVTFSAIVNTAQQCSASFCDYDRKLVSSIHQEHLPDSVGLDVLSSLDFAFQSQLADEIIDAVQPYSSHFEKISESRQLLCSDLARFKLLINESDLKGIGKALLEGITLGILSPSTDDENFINEYFSSLSHYGQQWDNLAPIIHNSVVQLNVKTYEEAIRFAINKMQPIFDEFNARNISLRDLLKQLRKG